MADIEAIRRRHLGLVVDRVILSQAELDRRDLLEEVDRLQRELNPFAPRPVTGVLYVYQHQCPPFSCDEVGKRVEFHPEVIDGIEQHVHPLCASSGVHLAWISREVIRS